MLSVIMLSVIKLSVIMLNAVMLSVVAPITLIVLNETGCSGWPQSGLCVPGETAVSGKRNILVSSFQNETGYSGKPVSGLLVPDAKV